MIDFTPQTKEWKSYALCPTVDPEIFFPDKGGDPRDAKRICMRCPVRNQCLEEALARPEVWGVWGGTTEYDRKNLRRRQRRVNQ